MYGTVSNVISETSTAPDPSDPPRLHYYQQLQIQQTLGAQPKENESTSLVLSLSFK